MATLKEIEPPRPKVGRATNYSGARLKEVRKQLRSGRWLSDFKTYPKRGAANWQAECLICALERDGQSREQMQRRTWPEGGGFKWAVRRRKPDGKRSGPG